MPCGAVPCVADLELEASVGVVGHLPTQNLARGGEARATRVAHTDDARGEEEPLVFGDVNGIALLVCATLRYIQHTWAAMWDRTGTGVIAVVRVVGERRSKCSPQLCVVDASLHLI